jgi:hypothetical protein
MKEHAMNRLIFVCPCTGLEIDVGIETEIDTLRRIRGNQIRAHCPNCGQLHEWQVCEARLLRQA